MLAKSVKIQEKSERIEQKYEGLKQKYSNLKQKYDEMQTKYKALLLSNLGNSHQDNSCIYRLEQLIKDF